MSKIFYPPLPAFGQAGDGKLAMDFWDYARAAVLADRETHHSALTARVAELEAALLKSGSHSQPPLPVPRPPSLGVRVVINGREVDAKGIERAALLAKGE